MMTNKQKKILHSIALSNNIRDDLAKKIVECPFMFMRLTIKDLDFEEDEKFNFYHKKLGRFYFNKGIYNNIIKSKKRIK